MTGVLALNPQNLIAPAVNGGTLGFSLDTSPVEILPINPQAQRLVFSNPGTGTVYVCQAFDENGNAQTPGPNPGNWLLAPGASLTFTGNGVAGAWLAAAAGGSSNPLTVSGLPGVVPPSIAPIPPPVQEFFFGLNLSGLEDNAGPPSQTEMAYSTVHSIVVHRLPINWSQLQPVAFGAIDPTYFAQISVAMANAAAVGAKLVPDFHNFGGAPDGSKLGQTTPITALADGWVKFAALLRADPNYHVIDSYDLMNEWSNMDPSNPGQSNSFTQNLILQANLGVYTALRADGDNTKIWFEWDNFSSAWSAVQDNIQILFAAMVALINVEASLHNYLDKDASGTEYIASQVFGQPSVSPPGITVTVNIGVQRATAVFALAQQFGVLINIGESGWSIDPPSLGGVYNFAQWDQAGFNLVDFCRQNKVPFFYWSGGPGFAGSYPLSPDPTTAASPALKDFTSAGVQNPQFVTIEKFTGYSGLQPTAYRSELPFGVVPYAPSGTPLPNFDLYYGGLVPSTVHFTGHAKLIDGTDVGGTFGSMSFPPGENGIQFFSYTPAGSYAGINLTFTNDGGLVDPPAIGVSSQVDFFNTTIGAVAPNIYSLRLLNSSYIGPAIRLQRSLDGAQMDFYFNVAGNLPRQAIQNWASSRSIQLVTWYDQSGNAANINFSSSSINLILVDASTYPSILISGAVRGTAATPSIGQGQMTAYAEINPSNGGDIVTQDLFSSNFRLTPNDFSIGPNNGTNTDVTIGASTSTWSDIAATYTNLSASNNLTAYIAGSQVHQVTAPQFVNASLFNEVGVFNFQFGDQHYAGSIRTIILQYLAYTSGNLSTLHGLYNTYYTTPLPDALSALSPTISDVANSKIFQGTSTPFFQTVITDGNPSQNDSVVITLSGASAALSGTGITGSNPYTIASATPASVTAILQALVLHTSASISSVINVAIAATGTATSNASFTVTVANYGIETAYSAPIGSFTPPNMKGVNMDGGENSPTPNYPHMFLTDYYAGKGFGLARMPFQSDLLLTSATGQAPLDISYITANIKNQVDYFRSKSMWCVLDLHQFGFINGVVPASGVVAALTESGGDCLIDFHSRLGSLFSLYDNVMIDLMNEPVNGTTASNWAPLAQKCLNALRVAGFNGPVLIEGGGNFSGAHDWTSSGNAAALVGITDSANNFYFSPHQYLNSTNSGTDPVAVSGYGSTALDLPTTGLFTTWCRANGFRAILGEGGTAPATWQPDTDPMHWSDTASPESTNGITEGAAMWNFMSANNDVFAGWAWWASNNFATGTPTDLQGKYAFVLDPPYFGGSTFYTPIVDQPQMAFLLANLASVTQFVATSGGLPSAVSSALTSIIGGPTRIQSSARRAFGYQPCQDIQVILPGFYWNGGAETVIPNNMPVQCSIWLPGAPTPLAQFKWSGSVNGSIPPGGAYAADKLNSSAFGLSQFPANTFYYIKFQVDLPAGASNFSGVGRDVIDADCACYFGSQASYTSQITNPGVCTSAGATGTGNSASPPVWTIADWAMIGTPLGALVSEISIGDSIEQGQLGPPFPNKFIGGGAVASGFSNVNGAYVPWASNAVFGTQGQGYAANAVHMLEIYKYATVGRSEFGSNDTGTLAAIIAAAQTNWSTMKSHPGSTITHVAQDIVTPRASSTDSWATLANQTTTNSYSTLNAAYVSNVGSNGLDETISKSSVYASPVSTPSSWTGDAASPPDKFPVTGSIGQAGPTLDGVHPTDFVARDQIATVIKTWALSRLQAVVTAVPSNVTAPFIIGARYQGSTLTVMNGAWSMGTSLYNTLSYQWKRDGTNISGATSQSYTLVSGDVGHVITCTVTATNAIGSTPITTAATGTIVGTGVTVPSFPASGAIASSQSIASGSSSANVSMTGGQTDPLGGTTATKVSYNSTANSQKVVNYAAAIVSNGSLYTCSIYAKPVEYQFFYMIAASGSLFGPSYIFDALNGLVFPLTSAVTGSGPVAVAEQVDIIAEPNSWFRAFITFRAIVSGAGTSAAALWFGPMATNSGNPVSPGAGATNSGLLFWNAQLVPGGIDS